MGYGSLTRTDITSAVHYVHLALGAEQIAKFASSPVALVIDHPNYHHESPLGAATIDELTTDLRDDA